LNTCYHYVEEEADCETGNVEKNSKSALERTFYYCNRYINHKQSLEFDQKLYDSGEKKKEMQRHGIPWFDMSFLKEALDILSQFRQTLMYTYVFSYFLRKNNQCLIFEDNQRDLEIATETLSGYVERDITSENVADIREILTDKYIYCDKRRKILLEHIDEGYEKNWWEFKE
jgi:ariadne-1